MMFEAEKGWTEKLEVGDEVLRVNRDHVFRIEVSRFTKTFVETIRPNTAYVEKWKRGRGPGRFANYQDEGKQHPLGDDWRWDRPRIWPVTEHNLAQIEGAAKRARDEASVRALRARCADRLNRLGLDELERLAEHLGIDETGTGGPQ